MLDKQEQAEWFQTYLDSALKFPAARGNRQQAEAWARSMSLIAEQFHTKDDRDLGLIVVNQDGIAKFARDAYLIADAMLIERAKSTKL